MSETRKGKWVGLHLPQTSGLLSDMFSSLMRPSALIISLLGSVTMCFCQAERVVCVDTTNLPRSLRLSSDKQDKKEQSFSKYTF